MLNLIDEKAPEAYTPPEAPMRTAGSTRPIMLLGGLLVFIGQSGCAFMHHQPAGSATLVDQLGTIGVLVRSLEGTRLYMPEIGQAQGAAGRAMGQGFASGFIQGFWCGPYFFICVPALAVTGAVAGGTIGWTYEVLMKETLEAESALKRALADLNLDDVIPDHVVSYATEHGYSVTPLPPQTAFASAEELACREILEGKRISTILEINGFTVELRKGMVQIFNKRRRLVISVWTRLIRTADGMVISERFITDAGGETRALDAWVDDDAVAFRAEMDQAIRRLAKQIVEELAVERTVSPVQPGTSIRVEDLPKPVQDVMDAIKIVGNKAGDQISKATGAVAGAIKKAVTPDPAPKGQPEPARNKGGSPWYFAGSFSCGS